MAHIKTIYRLEISEIVINFFYFCSISVLFRFYFNILPVSPTEIRRGHSPLDQSWFRGPWWGRFSRQSSPAPRHRPLACKRPATATARVDGVVACCVGEWRFTRRRRRSCSGNVRPARVAEPPPISVGRHRCRYAAAAAAAPEITTGRTKYAQPALLDWATRRQLGYSLTPNEWTSATIYMIFIRHRMTAVMGRARISGYLCKKQASKAVTGWSPMPL